MNVEKWLCSLAQILECMYFCGRHLLSPKSIPDAMLGFGPAPWEEPYLVEPALASVSEGVGLLRGILEPRKKRLGYWKPLKIKRLTCCE